MDRPIRLIIAVAAVMVLCRAVADRSEATVVRDGKSARGNPAVEVGGHSLRAKGHDDRPSFVVPASLFGAFGPGYPWLPSCVAWPLGGFGPFYWDRHGEVRRGGGSVVRLPRSGP